MTDVLLLLTLILHLGGVLHFTNESLLKYILGKKSVTANINVPLIITSSKTVNACH